jgi:hypothetical protein
MLGTKVQERFSIKGASIDTTFASPVDPSVVSEILGNKPKVVEPSETFVGISGLTVSLSLLSLCSLLFADYYFPYSRDYSSQIMSLNSRNLTKSQTHKSCFFIISTITLLLVPRVFFPFSLLFARNRFRFSNPGFYNLPS